MNAYTLSQKIAANIGTIIIGKNSEINLIIASLFAGGNVLLEDVPGTGKTMLSRALAASIDSTFKRIQFTPDLLPSDLLGITYYNPKQSEFIFRKGAVFTNILLADEINRATPRTQSALLEAMEEGQVTVDGSTYKLETPFFVIATQNPVETQGTYPLPEAQLDRFMIKLSLGYPTAEECISLVMGKNTTPEPAPVCTDADIEAAKEECRQVYIHKDLIRYIVDIAQATRSLEGVSLGLSTRGILAAVSMAKAYAATQNRSFVTPEDIKLVLPYVICHRLVLSGGYKHKTDYADKAVNTILSTVAVPTEDWSVR